MKHFMTMSTSLRYRQKGKRVFQLSGFADTERKEIGKLITALGGIDFDSESFRSNCTHIVCKKITRSEKFLGGCATAKWILHPNYIKESSKVGQWLDEQCYDWSQIGTADADNIPTDVKEAPRRWRYHFEVFGTTAFAGWKTAVVVSGARKNSVYKRLLHSGGAEVYNLKLPVTQPEKVTNTLTYVFANDKCAVHVAHLIEYGVLCLRPDYIGDYLIKDPPPDPLDYLVKVPEDSPFQDVLMNDSIRSSQTSDLDFSQAAPPSGRNSPEKKFLSLPSSASCSPVPVNVLLPLPTKVSNSRVKSVSDRVTRSSSREVLSTVCDEAFIQNQPVQTTNNNKRKFSEIVGVEDALQELKKLKVSRRRFLWKPVICVLSNSEEDDQQQSICVPMEFTDSMTNIIHSCLEEESSSSDFLAHALDLITSMIASRKYPKTDTIQFMIVKLLQNAASESLAIKSYTALMRLLQVHPPTTPFFTNLYMRTLAFTTKETEDSSQPWNFVRSVIQKIVEAPEDDHQSPELKYNLMLLKFLVALLEQNFKFCLRRYAENETCLKKVATCMISRVLWPGTSQFIVNNKCRELLSFVSSCLSSQLDVMQKTQVLPLLLSLISMAAECCRLTENKLSHVARSLPTSKEERTIAFIHEISRNIDVSHIDQQLLGLILRSLQSAWLCLGVCLMLLNNMDDYLVLEGVPRDSMERISLHTIVNKYFFMLPKLQEVTGNNFTRANTPVSTRMKMKDLKENETNGLHLKENQVMKNASRANKRNIKGETSLHRACIKNDVIYLRKLLKIPGIDINAKDNAGWTPLHEACNHGHIQCVKELLSFVPSKTVDTFFSTGENVCRKADLLLSNNEGVTPLHDAVLNDRLDVCRLLLQHGGWALLRCKTFNNATPQDLAVTKNMRNLLLSFEKEEHISSSQGSDCSQENSVPSEYLYDQVLRQEGAQQCSNADDCVKYVYLVTNTIRSYLEASNIWTLISLTRGVAPAARRISSFIGEPSSEAGEVAPVLNGITNFNSVRTHTQGSNDVISQTYSQEQETQGLVILDSHIVDTVKSDLKVVKNLKKYVQHFENHVMKISHPADHPSLKSQIMCLWCLAELNSRQVTVETTLNCDFKNRIAL